jgi:hypothetical protein
MFARNNMLFWPFGEGPKGVNMPVISMFTESSSISTFGITDGTRNRISMFHIKKMKLSSPFLMAKFLKEASRPTN